MKGTHPMSVESNPSEGQNSTDLLRLKKLHSFLKGTEGMMGITLCIVLYYYHRQFKWIRFLHIYDITYIDTHGGGPLRSWSASAEGGTISRMAVADNGENQGLCMIIASQCILSALGHDICI
jgi:hypothetical protein